MDTQSHFLKPRMGLTPTAQRDIRVSYLLNILNLADLFRAFDFYSNSNIKSHISSCHENLLMFVKTVTITKFLALMKNIILTRIRKPSIRKTELLRLLEIRVRYDNFLFNLSIKLKIFSQAEN